ncbi:hypothetical protein E3P99_03185 [Wallemia hederae]|uniref:Uncharacterized protein n=1 Tax=Wallemia hederae TaxID=1540922 RepID=A0A4V4LTC9_9BASI|nr:hypothetical protein E3P99_03185 [Wallemia hederae]
MVLDKDKLKSNYGNIYLIKFLNNASVDSIEKNTLVDLLINPNQEYPTGRLIRHLIARLILSYDQSSLNIIVGDLASKLPASTTSDKAKSSTLFVLGQIIQNNPGKFSSISADLYNICIKYLRNSNLSSHLRFHSGLVIAKILATTSKALTESHFKELFKYLKTLMTDKSYPVQRISTKCIANLSSFTNHLSSGTDIEQVVGICIKTADIVDQQTRQQHTALAAQLLASTQFKVKQHQQSTLLSAKGLKRDKKNSNEVEKEEVSNTSVVGLMPLKDMLSILSNQFSKGSRRVKVIVIDIYASLFSLMGSKWVESNYQLVVDHLLCSVMDADIPRNSDLLTVRSSLSILLRDHIGKSLLSEQGQGLALNVLIDNFLMRYTRDGLTQPKYSEHSLTLVVEESIGLLDQLGSAPIQAQDSLPNVIIKLLAHPSFSVQVAVSRLFYQFHLLSPNDLEASLGKLIGLLDKKLAHLRTPNASPDVAYASIGYACATGSLIGLFRLRPLNAPVEVPFKVFELAQSILKTAGECEFDQASIHIQVAWLLIDFLMSVGPQFVSSIISQLMLLWRNSLAKIDMQSNPPKSQIEWTFLLHIRECALTALLSYLKFNSSTLLNADSSRKLVSLLVNTLAFSNSFTHTNAPLLKDQIPTGACAHPNIGLLDRDVLLKRRIFQCAVSLEGTASADNLSAFIEAAFLAFGDPERYAGSAAQAAIASGSGSSGSFAFIWSVSDGYGYGLTSLYDVNVPEGSNQISEKLAKELKIRKPSPSAHEHDIVNLFENQPSSATPQPAPATGLVDAAISFFSHRLTDLDSTSMIKLFDHIRAAVKNPKLDRNPGRKMAIMVNTLVAVLGFLSNGKSRKLRTVLSVAPIRNTLQELFEDAITNDDAALRRLGAESLGRLIALTADRSFMTTQSRFYLDMIVNNRGPSIRSGSALALSEIYKQVGGMAAGPLLNSICEILTSLASDSHPEVHYYSLEAFYNIVEAAGSAFSPYVTRTLGLLASIHNWESHEPEGGQTILSTNSRSDYPLYKVLCKILDAIIGILGPEINEMNDVRDLLFLLVKQMMKENDDLVRGNALRSLQHFVMFAPDHTDIPTLLRTFQSALKSSNTVIRTSSINGLYQLSQKYVKEISQIGGDRLVEDLFVMLDKESDHEGLKLLILSWLKQTCESNAEGWLSICQKVFTKASQGSIGSVSKDKGEREDDEEVQGLGAAKEEDQSTLSSWQTQLFALDCVHALILSEYSREVKLNVARSLQGRVADLIKLAFVASTSRVELIRIRGLVVLRDVIETFAHFKDGHDDEASLLEQHQAPITAALTPAFGSDTTPDIIATAIQVCATFVKSGIVQDASNMGRVLKLLTSALRRFKGDSDKTLPIGEVGDLCSTANEMLKVSTLAAWAELGLVKSTKPYLKDVLEPLWNDLLPMWAQTIQQYAEMKEGVLNEDVLSQQILLPYHELQWLKITNAFVVSLGTSPAAIQKYVQSNARVDGSVQLRVLYGIASATLIEHTDNVHISLVALNTIAMLIRHPESDDWILNESIFDELLGLLWRIVTTAAPRTSGRALELLGEICNVYGEKLIDNVEIPSSPDSQFGKTLPRKSKITKCLQLAYSALSGCLDENRQLIICSMEHKAYIARSSVLAYLDICSTLAATTRVETLGILLHKYAELLRREDGSIHLIAVLLPLLRNVLLLSESLNGENLVIMGKTVHGFLSFALQTIDEVKTREGPAIIAKRKYSILVAISILASASKPIAVSKEVVEHLCDILVDYVLLAETEDDNHKALIGSIIRGFSSQAENIYYSYMAVYLVKSLNANTVEPTSQAYTLYKAIIRSKVLGKQQAQLYGKLINSCLRCLKNNTSEMAAADCLLDMASADAAAFKTASSRIEGSDKPLLESAMRDAVARQSGSTNKNTKNEATQPSISLKAFK